MLAKLPKLLFTKSKTPMIIEPVRREKKQQQDLRRQQGAILFSNLIKLWITLREIRITRNATIFWDFKNSTGEIVDVQSES